MKNFILIIYCFTFLIIPSVYSQKGRPGPKIVDIDGNSYKTVYIGKQHWMAENLKTTTYSDGTPIENDRPIEVNFGDYSSKYNRQKWMYLHDSWYDSENYVTTKGDATPSHIKYGKYYIGYAIGLNNVCPVGWHVPDKEEWLELFNYLGGKKVAAGKMYNYKYAAFATNSSLFSAKFGGFISGYDFREEYTESMSCWWTSTEKSTEEFSGDANWVVKFMAGYKDVQLEMDVKHNYYPVRCIYDGFP
jgi:uncharacterized protein (TIGR02145 family)